MTPCSSTAVRKHTVLVLVQPVAGVAWLLHSVCLSVADAAGVCPSVVVEQAVECANTTH
jgi:hypothetical protein